MPGSGSCTEVCRGGGQGGLPDDPFAAEEEIARGQAQARYEQRLRDLDKERRRLQEVQDQSSEFLRTLRENQQLAGAVGAYRELAENNTKVICRCFPTFARKITTWMGLPVEAVERDFASHLPPRRDGKTETVYNPIGAFKMIDYLITPGHYPYSVLGRGELMLWRVLILAVLAAGVVDAFALSPVMIPAAVVLSLVLVVLLSRKGNRRIEDLIPWDELRICRFILNYTIADAEPLARREHNLPEQNGTEYAAQHQEIMNSLLGQRSDLEAALTREQDVKRQTGRLRGELAEQVDELQKRAVMTNSRLGHAIQKRQNGMELTENETLLLNNYDGELIQAQGQLSEAEARYQQSCRQLEDLEMQRQRLAEQIRQTEDAYWETSARLSQIEEARSLEDVEHRMARERERLGLDHDRELKELQDTYSARRNKWANDEQKKADAAMVELQRRIRAQEDQKKRLDTNVRELEREKQFQQQALQQLKSDSQEAARQASSQRETADALYTAKVWQSNCMAWQKASAPRFGQPADVYAVRDHAYIMGPDGPYRMDHGCHPCVLLYDSPAEDSAESRPAYYLAKTVRALKFGLRLCNSEGLVDFALVDEYGSGGEIGRDMTRCYNSQTLGELNRLLDQWKQELSRESMGRTVSEFNQAYARYLLENQIGGSPEDLQRQLRKTLFVFVMPRMTEGRPMNSTELWQKLREDCGDFGFVLLLFIPQRDWDAALDGSLKGAFADAVKTELNSLSHIRKIHIPLNG